MEINKNRNIRKDRKITGQYIRDVIKMLRWIYLSEHTGKINKTDYNVFQRTGLFKVDISEEQSTLKKIILQNTDLKLDEVEKYFFLSVEHSRKVCREVPDCSNCCIINYCDYYRKNFRTESKITFVDLFCGAGGKSLGFEGQGFYPLLAVDFDDTAMETFRLNRPNFESDNFITADITDIFTSHSKLLEECRNKFKIDVMIGGPPCQGFSEANRQRMIDDPRNNLYRSYIKLAEFFEPDILVMENVRGITKISSEILDDFRKAGYTAGYRLYNMAEYGIPQNRIRAIFIGVKSNRRKPMNNVCEIFANIDKFKSIARTTLWEAISDLPVVNANTCRNETDIENNICGWDCIPFEYEYRNEYLRRINEGYKTEFLFNHKARFNNERDIEIFRRLPEGGQSDHESIQDIQTVLY